MQIEYNAATSFPTIKAMETALCADMICGQYWGDLDEEAKQHLKEVQHDIAVILCSGDMEEFNNGP